jgi:hypothetical protein
MSSTKSHRNKKLSRTKESSADTHDPTYSLDLDSDKGFVCSQKSVFYQGSISGFSKVICNNHPVFFAIDRCKEMPIVQSEYLTNPFGRLQTISALNTLDSLQNSLKSAKKLTGQIFDSQIIKISGHNPIASKSVFEMSAGEFNKTVASRANQIVYQRWEKGLPLSVPAGPGNPANYFFHVYKDNSTTLVELDEASGKVNFIKQVI